MSRYVDADEILRQLRFAQNAESLKDSKILAVIISDFEKIQEHIVRCKDCKWYDTDGGEMDTQGHCWYKNGEPVMQNMKPDDFCSYGERKEQEDED